MQLIDGKLTLSGYPSGARIVDFKSSSTERLQRLRNGAMLLQRAKHLMDTLGEPKASQDMHILEAIAIAVSGYYFACFAQGSMSPSLNPKGVFKGMPEALARHEDWKKIRDKRFHHPASVGQASTSGVVTDSTGNYLDFQIVFMDFPIGQLKDWMQLLYQLICVASAYIESASEKCVASIRSEFSKTSRIEIESLPEPYFEKPNY